MGVKPVVLFKTTSSVYATIMELDAQKNNRDSLLGTNGSIPKGPKDPIVRYLDLG